MNNFFAGETTMRCKRDEHGFTMIELLIVVVILGLLMSLVAPTMFSKVDSTKIKTARAQMQMLETSLDTYWLDMGEYPTKLDNLYRSSLPGWDGPYLPKAVPDDPWSNPYFYQSPGPDGEPFVLMSHGKDGRQGGEDDAADIVHQ
jgi:general secretion pathway protein G